MTQDTKFYQKIRTFRVVGFIWVKLILDRNLMHLLGFSKHVINPGYNRSDLTPNIDKTKYLKIYCNIVDNKNGNEHLTNVFI